MASITKQNSDKLKTKFNLGSELASNVAVYSNMAELNADIDKGKYNSLDYSIIFVGTNAYVFKKEDYDNEKFNLYYSSDNGLRSGKTSSLSTIIPSPYIRGVNQNNLKITGGMSAYLNNYINNH